MISQLLSAREIASLKRVGDLILPAHGDLPAFSQSGCCEHIDELLADTDAGDIRDLKHLLTLLSFFPVFALRALLWLIRHEGSVPHLPGIPLRLLNFALKGVVVSLYYSDLGSQNESSGVHAAIEYRIHCAPGDSIGAEN